jgi:radical SAM superfamily enzyme YgiQ (UPF0313 family)
MAFERPEVVRPPGEWESYFLPLTSGCSNNTCTFCGYYGSKLMMREVDEIENEIDALSLYVRAGIQLPTIPNIVYHVAQSWNKKRIFLQDGDALVYPFPKLKEVLEYLNEKFPDLERIGCYATPQDILRRNVDELRVLKRLKLGIFYVGLESGSDEVLQKVGKGVSSDQAIEAGKKAREAGITMSITVILGLAGTEGSENHALATARVLSAIDPEYVGSLTLTLVPGTPLYQEWKEGKFQLISPFQSLMELKLMVENSDFTNCFFGSMHASNYQAIRGRLPQEKEKMLRELEYVLQRNDPSLLRPEHLRGL